MTSLLLSVSPQPAPPPSASPMSALYHALPPPSMLGMTFTNSPHRSQLPLPAMDSLPSPGGEDTRLS
ncbi:unnamed protein product, partial [Dibothriocephalus latus]